MLEYEELHPEDLVGVGSVAEIGVVGVQGSDYGSEVFPVDCLVYFWLVDLRLVTFS